VPNYLLGGIKYAPVRRVTLIAVAAASFLIGLASVQLGGGLNGWLWPLLALALLPFCFRKQLVVAAPVAVVIGLILGIWRGTGELTLLDGYQNYLNQKVVVSGDVVEDPVFDDKGMTDFKLQNVTVNGRQLPGQVRVKAFTIADVKRDDTVQASGKLTDGFGGYQASVYYATVNLTEKAKSPIDNLRRHFAASVLSNMPEPQASLGLGFLLGIKTGISNTLNDQMKLLGLTHIVVASGYNLTILVRLARRLFERISKFQTAAVSTVLMAGFVAVTGFSASMSRAALVTGLALTAWYYGRRIHPITLLLFAAAVTAAVNPLFLWGDLGWWLSFLAFGGVLILAPLLQKRIFGDKKPKLFGQIVLETISAQLLAMPLIMFVFGNFSVLSLLANVLVVPLVPLAMLLTFVGGIAGVLLPGVAPVIALPATILLSFITEVVQSLAQIPWASLPVTITPPIMLGFYGAVAAVGWLIYTRTKFSFSRTSVVE